jgi:hypothetical protein
MEASGQHHAPAILPPDKETWYPLNNIQSERFREDKIFFLLPEFESRTV